MIWPTEGTDLLPRHAVPQLLEALRDFRVAVLNGARQAGKTTVLRQLHLRLGGTTVTFDDASELAAARADPTGYLEGLVRPVFVDEIQRAGDPFVLAVKAAVDRQPEPGSFVLSGSTRFLTVPNLSESLAGRATILELWPMSMAERAGAPPRLLDRLVNTPDQLRSAQPDQLTRHEYMQLVCGGGFPEALTRSSAKARASWFASYVTTVTQREIREIAQLRHATLLPQLVRLLGALTAQELVVAGIAQDLGLSADTTRDYVALLETVYLLHLLPAWSRNLTAKVKRRPKIHMIDTGLAAWLTGSGVDALARPGNSTAGALLETFVVNELAKLREVSETQLDLYHLQDRDGSEIDCVIETPAGRVVGIEVKASATVTADDFRHLRTLHQRLGDDFTAGVVFYTGARPLPFGDRLIALPVSMLWAA